MAITGRLLADFSQFNTAVEKAETELKSMQSEAGKVSASLNRMVDQFSGRKLVQEATLAAKAIREIGGLSQLTEKEIVAFADRSSEALLKLKLAGREIPEGLQHIADQASQAAAAIREFDKSTAKAADTTKAASQQTSILGGTFAKLTAAFSASSLIDKAIGSITDFAKGALESSGALVDMSNKTGLSIETLQRMGGVAKQTGTTVEAFADAAFKLGTTVAEGTGKARQAAEDLGLSWQHLRSLSPDDQFAEVVAALEKMEDPQRRNTDAVNLFGKTAKEILSAVKDGYTDMAAAVDVAGEAQVRALDNAGDAIDRWKDRITKGFIQAIGNALLLREAVAKLTQEQRDFLLQFGGAKTTEEFDAQLIRLAEHSTSYATSADLATAATKRLIEATKPRELVDPLGNIRLPTTRQAPPPLPPSFTAELKAAEQGYRALTAAQVANLEAAFKLGKSNDDIINSLNITDGVLDVAKKAWQDHQKAATDAIKAIQDELSGAALAKDVKDLQTAVDGLGVSLEKWNTIAKNTSASRDYADVLERIADKAEELWKKGAKLSPQLMEIAVAFGRISPKVEDGIKSLAGFGQVVAITIPPIYTFTEALKGANAEILKVTEGLPSNFSSMFNIDPGFDKGAKKLIDEIHAANQATVDLGQEFQHLGGIVGGELGSIINDFGRLTESIGRAQQQLQHFRETGTHATTGQRIGAFVEGASDIIGATGSGSTLKRGIAGGIAGAQAGATIGAVFAPETLGLSIAVGAIAGGLVGIIRGKLAHDGRKAVEEFANSFQGGFDELHQRLHMLGDEGERLWKSLTQGVGRNNPEQAAQVIDEINRSLADADKQIQEITGHQNEQLSAMLAVAGTWQTLPESVAPYIDQLEQAGLLTQQNADLLRQFGTTGPDDFTRLKSEAEKFGVSLDALGPKFAQSEVTAKSTEIIQFFDEAIARGGDFNGILDGMKDEISDVVQQSLKFGTEIPGNMQPWIEQLAKSGQLLDENGRKITDTSKLKFGEKVSSSLDDVVGKLQEMIDLMTNGLPSAVGTVASSFDKNKGAFDSWRDHGVRAARDVADEVDRVSFGSSPGGLKEIPIQLGKATAALAPFSSAMTTTMSKAFVALTTVTDSLDMAAPSVDEATKHLQTMTVEMRKGSTASTFGAAFKGSVDATKESIDEARHSWEIMVAEMEQGGVGASVAAGAKDDLDALRKSADGTKASLKGFTGTILTTTATGAMTAAAAIKGVLGGTKASADDTTKSLQTMTRAISKQGPMTDMAAAFKGTLDGTKGSIATVGSALATNKNAWRDWQGLAGASAKAVQREVDAISFGRSPGGLKEIPLMLSRSVQALRVFSTAMSTTGIPRMLPTLSEPARVLRGPWPGSGAAGGKDGGMMATVNLHMDGQRFARTMVRAVPGVVKDYKLSH